MPPARPRVRIRVWWLMVAVAVVALATRGCIWAELMERRATYYRDLAGLNGALARRCRGIAEAAGRPTSRAGRLADYYESLEQKYARAATHPWIDPPPDPPPPD